MRWSVNLSKPLIITFRLIIVINYLSFKGEVNIRGRILISNCFYITSRMESAQKVDKTTQKVLLLGNHGLNFTLKHYNIVAV